jgi:DNA-binding beta-propeller fold protein YncE
VLRLLVLLPTLAAAVSQPGVRTPVAAPPAASRIVDSGIAIDFKLDGSRREGEPAQVRVTLTTESTGSPLGGAAPGAWFTLSGDEPPLDRQRCTARVAAFAGGNMLTRPAVNLNSYYVVALNGDASITVVDPLFGFGGTKLLGMVELESTGFDWTLVSNDDRLLVTMPAANRVAVIDTTQWKLLRSIDAGSEPRRIVTQADGHYVWITNAAGVTVLRASDQSIAATLATGKGPHDVVITPDDRTAIVTNRDDGTATIIDVAKLEIVAQGPAGPKPVAVAWSPLSQLAYVASEDGTITAIDPKRRKAVAHLDTEPGLERIRFAPGGRYGFTLNPARGLMHVIDVVSNRVIQTGELEGGPFEVTFTETLAYVRRRESEVVLMVPLAEIGKPGRRISVAEFPSGDHTFGKKARTTAADGIVSAPGSGAVLVANPADEHVYFYKEGMAAPSGHFNNYGHDPQAVLVLDRSLQERKPGVFVANTTLPPAGEYDVAVFVNAPRAVACFRVEVAENPDLPNRKPRIPLRVEHLTPQTNIAVGQRTPIEVRLTDVKSHEPARSLPDAGMLIVQAGGTWSDRQPLSAVEDGRYAGNFTAPAPGVYYVYIECPSAGLRASNPQFLILNAQ